MLNICTVLKATKRKYTKNTKKLPVKQKKLAVVNNLTEQKT